MRHLETICHVLVLGLERCVLGLSLGGQVLGLRGKALGLNPVSLVSLVFYVDWMTGLVLSMYVDMVTSTRQDLGAALSLAF